MRLSKEEGESSKPLLQSSLLRRALPKLPDDRGRSPGWAGMAVWRGRDAGNLCMGFLLACSWSHTLHSASLHRCHHINIPVTIAYCQTQFRKVPVCYKYFIVLEYAIYVTCPAKEIHYMVLSD